MITIFTPTYNRVGLLNRLYDSLISQSNSDFEWLIVDDGSSDNTKHVVQDWISENKIKIRYIYQKNSGKYVAFNTGVMNAHGELFFCVDSDDYLPDNAVKLINGTWSSSFAKNISGIIALKCDISNNILNNEFPPHIKIASPFELTYKYSCGGERSLVYKTSILIENLFPVIPTEKFVTECVVYDKIDLSYKMLVLNKVLTVCEYQPNGLTSSIFDVMIKNPIGYKIFYKQRIDMAYNDKQRFGFMVRYNAFKILSCENEYDYSGKYNFGVFLTKPFGWLLTKYYKLKKRLK